VNGEKMIDTVAQFCLCQLIHQSRRNCHLCAYRLRAQGMGTPFCDFTVW
jgi:hypothetical protein